VSETDADQLTQKVPDYFKVHFRRRFTTNLFETLDGYLALLVSGLAAISVRSVF
jgi:hypothetical protein